MVKTNSNKTRAELLDEAFDMIISPTDAECSLLLRSWKIHEANPALTPEECLDKAEAEASGKGATA